MASKEPGGPSADFRQDQNVGFNSALHTTFTAYVDDLITMAPLDIRLTSEILDNIAELPTLASTILMERGMAIKSIQGKLALLVSLAGPNVRQAKQVVADTKTVTAAGIAFHVGIMYTHLGGIIDNNAGMGFELKRRTSSVRALSTPVRAHMICKASLTLDQHATVVDALVLSSLFHNCQTLCGMTVSNWHTVNSKVALPYGSVIKDEHLINPSAGDFSRIKNSVILKLAGRHDGFHQIRLARQRFLLRLLRNAPPALIQVLDAPLSIEASFSKYLDKDLEWLATNSDACSQLANPNDNLLQWLIHHPGGA